MGITELSFAINGVILAWLTYQESRMQAIKADIKDRLELQESVNKESRDDVKAQISRLEAKIDTLTMLLLNGQKTNDR